MPRYFFDIHDGVDIIDEVGTELPSFAAVRDTAVRASGEAIKDLGIKFWDSRDWRLEVQDEQDKVVLTLNFSGEASQDAA